MIICSRLPRRAARLASLVRRSRAGHCLLLLGLGTITACSVAHREPPRQYTAAQQRMLAKFGPIGYELKVDAMRGEEFEGVNFYEVGIRWPIYGKGGQTLRNETRLGMSGPIPEQLRVVWRDSAEHGRESKDGTTYSGKIIGDEIIEVGSRIPQALVDDLKRDPRGTLRLKFRMSKQGTMLGWDIQRRPGYTNFTAEEIARRNIYFPPAHNHSGGDFKEARPAHYVWDGQNFQSLPSALPTPLSAADSALLKQHDLMLAGKDGGIVTSPPTPRNYRRIWEKGWYIDRKTGQKIETDY